MNDEPLIVLANRLDDADTIPANTWALIRARMVGNESVEEMLARNLERDLRRPMALPECLS